MASLADSHVGSAETDRLAHRIAGVMREQPAALTDTNVALGEAR